MKVDLHCHTRKVKQGDSAGRDVTPEVFLRKVTDANVGLVAITNHNLFDIDQFENILKAVDKKFMVWPGIELDVKINHGKKWHMLVIANPENYVAFSASVQQILNDYSGDNHLANFQDVFDVLQKHDVIYIPHLHKEPSITKEDIVSIEKIVQEKHRIFYEPPNFQSLMVYANHGYRMMIGSDLSSWDNYEKNTFPELRLPVSSFSQFCLLAKRDVHVIANILSGKESFDVIAKPHSTVDINLRIFKEVNVIFGHRGTGKSEILKSVQTFLTTQGKSSVKYTGSEKEQDFKTLLDVKNIQRELDKVDGTSCVEEIAFIRNWKDSSPTPYTNYVKWFETHEKNKNKAKLLITNSSSIPEASSSDLSRIKSDYSSLKKIKHQLDGIDLNLYLVNERVELLNEIIQELTNLIQTQLTNCVIELYSVTLTNYSTERIKSLADAKTATFSRPSSTGFRDYTLSRLKLRQAVQKILVNTKKSESAEKVYLGNLEDKGSLFIRTRYRMLCELSNKEEFELNKFNSLKRCMKTIEKIGSDFYTHDIQKVIPDFTVECDALDLKDIDKFLGISKSIVDFRDDDYIPSSGEKGILLLQKALSEDADVYLLDEPDLGMGNSYIDQNIRPKISQLGKIGKVVLIATHNANIAVRTLPYNRIYRHHENGVFKTFIGNPFVDSLTNIENPAESLSWTEVSMKVLEGSEEAFYERKRIYETGNYPSLSERK